MAAPAQQHTTTEVRAPHEEAEHEQPGLIDISSSMMLWTWVTFLLTCVVLYKVAWRPILNALEKREEEIRTSLENAENIRHEMERLEQTQKNMIADAENEAKQILAQARTGAAEAARNIEAKAKEESQIMIENATREIRAAQEKAQAALKKESAELAVSLATKILGERLDTQRDAQLVDKLVNEI